MLYKQNKPIKTLGVFTYEVIKDDKYGVKISCDTEEKAIYNAFNTYEEAHTFAKVLFENDVTCVSLKYIFEDYMYDKYKKITDGIR